jgi:hypothetical protein
LTAPFALRLSNTDLTGPPVSRFTYLKRVPGTVCHPPAGSGNVCADGVPPVASRRSSAPSAAGSPGSAIALPAAAAPT